MSDAVADSGFSIDAQAPAASSAGQLLRAAREACGLHIAALAVSLKVPVRKLEALEADRLQELPDAVFARALASSVCRVLKIDPAPILARLPATNASLVSQRDAGINAPFRAPGDVPAPSAWRLLARPPVLALIALGVGVLVLMLLPSLHLSSSMVTRDTATRPAAPPVEVMPGTATETVLPSDGPRTVESVAAVPAPAVSAPLVSTPVAAAVPATAAPAAAPSASAGLVSFVATGDSWIEVRDAQGALTLQRTLKAGESASAGGVLPLAVTVGRANATRVQVRGRDFDIAALARENVARFEVK